MKFRIDNKIGYERKTQPVSGGYAVIASTQKKAYHQDYLVMCDKIAHHYEGDHEYVYSWQVGVYGAGPITTIEEALRELGLMPDTALAAAHTAAAKWAKHAETINALFPTATLSYYKVKIGDSAYSVRAIDDKEAAATAIALWRKGKLAGATPRDKPYVREVAEPTA